MNVPNSDSKAQSDLSPPAPKLRPHFAPENDGSAAVAANADPRRKQRNYDGKSGGRGGIRTHGGSPHARFRVECLKPDSATLPALELSMVKGAALCNDDGFCAGESEYACL